MDKLHITITTLSNLCIGGSPSRFEIGGVDTYTAKDYQGRPYIPGSSLKGALRNIVRELQGKSEAAQQIGQAYQRYFQKQKEESLIKLQQIEQIAGFKDREEAMNNRFEDLFYLDKNHKQERKDYQFAEYLFGAPGFNQTPKLIVNELVLAEGQEDKELFSEDTKNAIEVDEENVRVSANPRTYQTVRPGVVFRGEISFRGMDKLGTDARTAETVMEFIETAVKELNSGIYGLGNSRSRGYGRVRAEVRWERDGNA